MQASVLPAQAQLPCTSQGQLQQMVRHWRGLALVVSGAPAKEVQHSRGSAHQRTSIMQP